MEEKSIQNNTGAKGVHKVYLNARKSAVMSGVKDVLSFDAKEGYLETNQGVLLIKGDELHVNRLSLEKDVYKRQSYVCIIILFELTV